MTKTYNPSVNIFSIVRTKLVMKTLRTLSLSIFLSTESSPLTDWSRLILGFCALGIKLGVIDRRRENGLNEKLNQRSALIRFRDWGIIVFVCNTIKYQLIIRSYILIEIVSLRPKLNFNCICQITLGLVENAAHFSHLIAIKKYLICKLFFYIVSINLLINIRVL